MIGIEAKMGRLSLEMEPDMTMTYILMSQIFSLQFYE